ncbi:hypothetical protein HYH03_002276 [Edaphochlamys debaryana]|uniref:Uncharacterized protein n=1 Tax=Edaphochlamys debaryana TaxID=47281 RepID=A0A835YE07_9CHLO|nr:hypothetical protein HYH03_002276 [Edaphochlamys debaryana]|eukprot:KAG2499994.1 hypothetical protein HYH03_002276 [Edaphochlamys debaryana]
MMMHSRAFALRPSSSRSARRPRASAIPDPDDMAGPRPARARPPRSNPGRPPASAPSTREPNVRRRRAPAGLPSQPPPPAPPAPGADAPPPPPAPASPPGPGFKGTLRYYHHAPSNTSYFTGAATLEAALPMERERALTHNLRSQPVNVYRSVAPQGTGTAGDDAEAEAGAGGLLHPYSAVLYWLCKAPGTAVGEWRLSKLKRLATALGLQNGDFVEAWILPGGELELRRRAGGQQPSPHMESRTLTSRTPTAEPKGRARQPAFEVLGASEASGAGSELTRSLGRLRLTVGASKLQLTGAEAVRAAWPEACSAAGEARANQDLQLLARRPADGGPELCAYNLRLLWRVSVVSSVHALVQHLGLRNGDELELWRRVDGRVEARRDGSAEEGSQ